MRVWMFPGLKEVFLMTAVDFYFILHASLQISFCAITLVHIKDANKITNNKIKKGSSRTVLCYCFPVISKAGCSYTPRRIQSWRIVTNKFLMDYRNLFLLALINPEKFTLEYKNSSAEKQCPPPFCPDFLFLSHTFQISKQIFIVWTEIMQIFKWWFH